MHVLLYCLFVLSGAAGLIYESIWSRYLGLFVGHSAYAQIIVIAIFLGGMSWGALVVSRRSEKIKEPLVWYAYVELAVGLLGMLFHNVFLVVSNVAYDSIFPALAGSPMLGPVKWLIAALLILPQSFLLGTTFPLMSAGVIRLFRGREGRVLSMLYFSNSLGAAAGVLLAGFFLIRISGLPGTVLAAAIINCVVGLAVLSAVRYVPNKAPAPAGEPALQEAATAAVASAEVPGSEANRKQLLQLLLAVAFGTAIASFIYEIAWIRMLSLVLGSATHSFELMLSAFILGLSLGALWVRTRVDRFKDPVRTLGVVQLLMGAAALATLPVYLLTFQGTATLLGAFTRDEASYQLFTLSRYAFCLAVMLPATFFAGITLPLITRTLMRSGNGESAIGTVYSVNTLGSIIGVAIAGLILMPVLGVKGMLIGGAVVDMVLGLALLAYTGSRFSFAQPKVAFATLAVIVLAVTASLGAKFEKELLTSGVFRTGRTTLLNVHEVMFYKHGRTASVSVSRNVDSSFVAIATNGKPDASLDARWAKPPADSARPEPLGGDLSTQFLVPLIALAHNPDAKLGAMIGHGSGMSSHFLLASPQLQKLFTIEIEPQMIEGSRHFYPANKRVFDDKERSEFIIDDAKSYFAATAQKFDIIISEPSNPWVSGVSGLFTVEFYTRVQRYMADDGIFAQWLHLYEISDGLVLSVLAALHASFPSYDVFQTASGDMVIIASLQKTLPVADWRVAQLPEVSADLRHSVKYDSLTLEATRILSRDVLAPLLDQWAQPNSDFYPVLDLGAEKTRFMRDAATGFSSMWSQGFNVAAALMNKRAGQHDDKLAVVPELGTVFSRAMSARTRRGGAITASDSVDFPGLVRFQQDKWAFDAALASSEPPKDWALWTLSFIHVEEILQRGTSGFLDSTFYASVDRFVRKHAAPPRVMQTIRFMRAVAELKYAEVSAAADSLLQLEKPGESILSPDYVRDAGVIAKLRLGDVVGARRMFDGLAHRVARSPGHFQTRLLEAYVERAEAKLLSRK